MHAFRQLNGVEVAPHACATSCCFLGYAPEAFAEDPLFREMMDGLPNNPVGELPPITLWCSVSKWVVGGDYWDVEYGENKENEALWQFLFSGGWPDDPEFAARRALKVLLDLTEEDIREEGWYAVAGEDQDAEDYRDWEDWHEDPRWFEMGGQPIPGKIELQAALRSVVEEWVDGEPS
jgi:hypothetical protein